MGSSPGPCLSARVVPAADRLAPPTRIYSDDDVLRLDPPGTVHVSAWHRSYTIADPPVVALTWAKFDPASSTTSSTPRMVCIAMASGIRIVADDGRAYTVPMSEPVRALHAVPARGGVQGDGDGDGGGVLLELPGQLLHLRHPLEAARPVARLEPNERVVLYDDVRHLVSYDADTGRVWVWSSTVAAGAESERTDLDESPGSILVQLDLKRLWAQSIPSPLSTAYMMVDVDGMSSILCCQSVSWDGRLDLFHLGSDCTHIGTIQAVDSVAIDSVLCDEDARDDHRELVVLDRDGRLSLWTDMTRICTISIDSVTSRPVSVSQASGSCWTATDGDGRAHHCDLRVRFTSPLAQLCFQTLCGSRCIPYAVLYALAAEVQARVASRPGADEFAVLSVVLLDDLTDVAAADAVVESDPWHQLLQTAYHRDQIGTPLYVFDPVPGVTSTSTTTLTPSSSSPLEHVLYPYADLILNLLHLLYEAVKLDSMSERYGRSLLPLLYALAQSRGRAAHVHYYEGECPELLDDPNNNVKPKVAVPSDHDVVDVTAHLLSCLNSGHRRRRPVPVFPHGPEHRSPLTGAVRLCHIYAAFPDPEQVLLRMVQLELRPPDLNTLPFGIALPLRAVLHSCRAAPRPSWPPAAFALVERADLCSNPSAVTVVEAKPEIADPDGTLCVVELGRWRFARDHRLLEVRRLLRSDLVLQLPMNGADHDPDQAQVTQRALQDRVGRVLAQAVGRAMLTLASIEPIVSEALHVPPMVLSGRARPGQAAVHANPAPDPEAACWPAFHNGVAAGLRLRPCAAAQAADRAWIVYNRPATDPDPAHAGVVLALGLHGHLSGLARADLYWYLSKKHGPTTMAVILGLAASELGSGSVSVTRTLSLHIPALLPSGISASDIDIPVLVQGSALVAIGLVYQGSANRLMTEMLLTEIGRRPTAQIAEDRDAYAMCAGLGLGLVTLGVGDRAQGLADLCLVDRLTQLIQGGPCPSSSTDAATAPGAPLLYEPIQSNLVKEGAAINVAVTGPGAVLALGLIYQRTGNRQVAARLALPERLSALAEVRPDQIALRVTCRALVLWDGVVADRAWVRAQVPDGLGRAQDLDPDDARADARLAESVADPDAVHAAYCLAVSGACLALGLRFAGTANASAAAVLGQYVRWLRGLRERHAAPDLDRGALDDALAAVALALALVMSGTGHLATLSLLRSLRVPHRPATPYGLHMAVHMALGLLFLGGGRWAAGRRPGQTAVLLAALWPRWPRSPSDNRYHAQILRHLYVLGIERRYLDIREVHCNRPVLVPIKIEFRDRTPSLSLTAPCLLPEPQTIKALHVQSPRYWPVTVDFEAEPNRCRQLLTESGVLYVQRRTGHLPYRQDPVGRLGLVARTLPRSPDAARALVGSVAADPVLAAFARNLCSDAGQLGAFCCAVLYDCLRRDAPDMLGTYLHVYGAVVVLARPGYASTSNNGDCNSVLMLRQLKFVLEASSSLLSSTTPGAGVSVRDDAGAATTEPLLQGEFVEGLRARLQALFRDCVEGDLLRAWVRGGLRAVPAPARARFALALTVFDLPSAESVRAFVDGGGGGVRSATLVPQLMMQFPNLSMTAIASLDGALRPMMMTTTKIGEESVPLPIRSPS